jgi:hypothetical protein
LRKNCVGSVGKRIEIDVPQGPPGDEKRAHDNCRESTASHKPDRGRETAGSGPSLPSRDRELWQGVFRSRRWGRLEEVFVFLSCAEEFLTPGAGDAPPQHLARLQLETRQAVRTGDSNRSAQLGLPIQCLQAIASNDSRPSRNSPSLPLPAWMAARLAAHTRNISCTICNRAILLAGSIWFHNYRTKVAERNGVRGPMAVRVISRGERFAGELAAKPRCASGTFED